MRISLMYIPALLFPFLASGQQTDSSGVEMISFHFQTTVINQFKPGFHADYSGPNSLSTEKESRTSLTATLFAGVQLWKGGSLMVNPEISGGAGLSTTLGVAAAPNGETFRIGDPAPQIYLARLFYSQVFALSRKVHPVAADFNQLGGTLPDRYLQLIAGKIDVVDYFDNNTYSHDPRTQFMSWGLMDNGAWDYPANTRGYTPSVVIQYITPRNEWRYAVSLLAVTANGEEMNWDIGRSSAHSLEYTHRYHWQGKPGALRLLAFFNTTHMGSYQQSLVQDPAAPDITATRAYGRTKFGMGINAEQQLNRFLGCFFRAGWNDGLHESWSFTEIDHGLSGGVSLMGSKWHRPEDQAGIAYVASGISKVHRDYLQAGGKGFILGDGNLHYGWEQLSECYYSLALVKSRLFLSGAYQLLWNPGYNRDRKGPVSIFSIRIHASL